MGLLPHLGGEHKMIDTVREALQPEHVSVRMRDLLERDLRSRAYLEKLRVSINEAITGNVRDAREIYPELT